MLSLSSGGGLIRAFDSFALNNMKRVVTTLICFVAAILIVKVLPTPEFLKSPYKGEAVETWETSNTPFRIRVDKHIEGGGFMPVLNSAYYGSPALLMTQR
jgi:hypothetical protein